MFQREIRFSVSKLMPKLLTEKKLICHLAFAKVGHLLTFALNLASLAGIFRWHFCLLLMALLKMFSCFLGK